MIRYRAFGFLLTLAVLAGGCTNNGTPPVPPTVAPSVDVGKYKLAAEPGGAKGVIDARKQAKDGDEVVVIGRIGGVAKPLTEGRASFLIVDPSLKPAVECDCPWDYCDHPKEERVAATATVRVVDDQGKTLAAGARELFGIKELTTVVVKGQAKRDEQGNLTILARGLFVRQDTP